MRILRLPGYRRQPPDPPGLGVMTPPPPGSFGPSRRQRRKQEWVDRTFWGLVNDHNWLQYDPRHVWQRHAVARDHRGGRLWRFGRGENA